MRSKCTKVDSAFSPNTIHITQSAPYSLGGSGKTFYGCSFNFGFK